MKISSLFPDLTAQLRSSSDIPDEVARWIHSQLDRARHSELATAMFDGVTDLAVLNLFHEGFAAARRVLDPFHIDIPAPETFSLGTHWQELTDTLTTKIGSSSCELVIAPHGLGLKRWQTIAADTVDLSVSNDIAAEFDRVDQVSGLQHTPTTSSPFGKRLQWSARLISTDLAPAMTGKKWQRDSEITLPELLMVQLHRALSGRELLDPHSFTWLAGTIQHGRRAPRHTFDRTTRTIRISSREIGQLGPHQGSRNAALLPDNDS